LLVNSVLFHLKTRTLPSAFQQRDYGFGIWFLTSRKQGKLQDFWKQIILEMIYSCQPRLIVRWQETKYFNTTCGMSRP